MHDTTIRLELPAAKFGFMNHISRFCFIIVTLCFLPSCHPQNEDIPPYEVKTDLRQDTTFTFEALANRFNFAIEADGDWSIEVQDISGSATKSIADWISVNPVSGGKGKYSIEVGVNPNYSLFTRQAHLLLRHQEKAQKWDIQQYPACYEQDGVITLAVHTPGTVQRMLGEFFSSQDKIAALRIIGSVGNDDLTTLFRLPISYLDLRETDVPSLKFAYHSSLKTLFLSDSATGIENNAFSSMTELEYIYGANVQKIGHTAFSGCKKLQAYYLPEVTEIGSDAFAGCENLKQLIFPQVKTIGDSAFRGCTGITEVSFDTLEELNQQLSGWNGPANIEKLNLPKLKHAGGQAFSYQSKLEKLHLPSLETCGMNLIYMSDIKEINCPAMKEIPESAFGGNEHLRRAVFEKATKVGEKAFLYDTKLKDVIMPLAESLEATAFYACNLGGELDFSSVKYIGHNCFERSEGLGSHVVRFPMVIWIGNGAFRYCTELTTIELPIITMIGSQAFFGCTKLISLADENRLPVVSLGDYAFGNCVSLKKLDFPTLTQLGGSACFDGCRITTLKFGALDWKKPWPETLWPDAPFEFWSFPMSDTKSTHLYLGLSPYPLIIDSNHPWWRNSGGTIMFMNRVWASINEYVQD